MILAIYCCGGQGREIMFLAKSLNKIYRKWDEIIFVDDNIRGCQPTEERIISFNTILDKYAPTDCEFLIASGEPFILKHLSNKVLGTGYRLTKLVADDALVADEALLKHGSIVQAKSVVASNVRIGTSSCVGFSSVLHHDVLVGDYCFIAANSTICGNVVIGDSTFIGAGCVIRDEIRIGSNCIIGIGSVVVHDIPDNSIAYGIPARVVGATNGRSVFA